jgi:hypothetical protein
MCRRKCAQHERGSELSLKKITPDVRRATYVTRVAAGKTRWPSSLMSAVGVS